MRVTKVLLGLVVAGAFGLVTAGASADPPAYSVAAGSGTAKITANAPWHVNTEYPWKLVCGTGDAKIISKKEKFTFTEKTAAVTGSGSCELRGGVCNGGQCQNFKESVNL